MRTARTVLPLLAALALAGLASCGSSVDTNPAHHDAAVDRAPVIDDAPGDDASDVAPPTDDAGADAGAMGPCGPLGPAPTDPLVAQTQYGQVRGVRDGNTVSFRGIPYAAPPTGALRFRPPSAPACWTGVRDATQYGSVCPQALPSGSRLGDEDCLFLNVWTPSAGATSTARPVLFFIHGGAYVFGSGSQDLLLQGTGNLYDGKTLADEQNAVVVSINYRLGGLGFTAHPALSAEDPHHSSGNYGIMDQVAALQWVRDNIAAFGGDPHRVTIFGESAGGLSVCLLLATPLAQGLYQSALVESGGCTVATQDSRFAQGQRVASDVGCAGASDVPACLRSKPAYSFVAELPADTYNLLFTDGALHMWELMNGPSQDGYVFAEKPLATLRAGRGAHVPLVVGTNAQEFQIFSPPLVSCFDYANLVNALFPTAVATEALVRYGCFDYPTPRDAFVALGTDMGFTCPARRILRAALAGGAPAAYRYQFAQTYSNSPLSALQSFHASELAFVFHTFDVLGYDPTDGDVALSRSMGGYWGRFAAAHDPNGAGAVSWPRYDVTADTAIHFADRITTTSHLSTSNCDWWDSVSPDLM